MHYSITAQMAMMWAIKDGKQIASTWINDFILLELLDDHLIEHTDDGWNLTYPGLKILQDWDPMLGVSVSNQLLQPCYGYA